MNNLFSVLWSIYQKKKKPKRKKESKHIYIDIMKILRGLISYHPSTSRRGEEWTPFEYCSPTAFYHLLVV